MLKSCCYRTSFSAFVCPAVRCWNFSSKMNRKCATATAYVSTQDDNNKMVDDVNLYSVRINTCSNLYKRQRELAGDTTRKPITGINMNVVYADTMPDQTSGKHIRVILALHGIVGSHRNFLPLFPHLSGENVRIIVPNFPGYEHTTMDSDGIFMHSDEERAEFVMDFLKALNIQKVHAVVTHSAGLYAALYMYRKLSTLCESFVWINPGGVRPVRAVSPLWLYRASSKILGVPVLKQMSALFLPLLTRKASPLVFTVDTLQVSMKTLLYTDYQEVRRILSEMSLQRFPIVLAMSRSDPVVGLSLNKDLIDIFHVDPETLFHYDLQGTLVPKTHTIDNKYPKGLLFDGGGHVLIKVYPELLANEILNILKYTEH